jgi:protein-tyrosine phosphatase
MQPEEQSVLDSYWVIPGRFMAGEFPSAQNEKTAWEKISWLLHHNLNHFIDLTETGEYGLQSYRRFLSEDAINIRYEITYQRFPITDMQTPTRELMRDILNAIDEALNSGKNVYLHCFGGIGRTGTVVGCYLVRHGMEGYHALEQIARWRLDSSQGWRISPETKHQRDFVLSWKG